MPDLDARGLRVMHRLLGGNRFAPDCSGGDAPEWMSAAVCASTDPDVFFPERGGSTREAKAVCRECPVAAECLTFAIEHSERYGVWGGTTEKGRRALGARSVRPRTLQPCGTPAAYRRHHRRLSKAACREATTGAVA